jgi:hypothetical protein
MSDKASALQLRVIDSRSDTKSELNHSAPMGLSRRFPIAATAPSLPSAIPDPILEYYAFIFCQCGFSQIGMTFEQFLMVVAAIKPQGLSQFV